jgi:hypothetical protein
MGLMNDLSQYVDMKQADSQQQNQGFSQLGQMLGMAAKEKDDEKRRQANVKKRLSEAQQMMQTMSQMPDNSASGKAVGTLNDDADKRRKGVISVSDYVPQQEMTVDETGALNLKFGYRRATPQEQKAQFETKKAQMDREKEQAKSDLLNAYAQDKVQEGAILGEMATLGITPEEFDMASQARERMRQIVSSQTFSGQPVQIPQNAAMSMAGGGMGDARGTPISMAQPQPIPTAAQPQEQGFRFDQSKDIERQKLEMEKAKFSSEMQDKAETREAKSTSAIDAASSSLSAIDHLIANKNYFGAIEGRMPAGLNQGKREWAKNYDFLEAKNILSVINEMKNQSRTGATGFGNMNAGELKVLRDASMRLDKQLDEKTAEKYLLEMKKAFQTIIDREKNGYDGQQQGGQQSAQDSDSVPSVGGTFNGEKVISVKRIR